MIPASGRARAEVTRAFNSYRNLAKDETAYLIDVGQVTFDTCDGQHPTAGGHQEIFKAVVPVLDKMMGKAPASRP